MAVTLHVNPPEAHTVNIEPLTADDWDSEYWIIYGNKGVAKADTFRQSLISTPSSSN